MTRISLRIAATLVTLTAALPVAAEAPLPLAVEFRAVSTMDRASPATPQLTSINYERLYRRLVQAGMISQVLGYTLTAAVNMPELTIDHCGPLLKNLPLLAMLPVSVPVPAPLQVSVLPGAGALRCGNTAGGQASTRASRWASLTASTVS